MDEISENYEEESADNIIAKLRLTFKDEAYELVAELEAALLEIEKAPHDQELIGRVFRAMHTIKGSGAACGLNDISSFTHELETIFDLVRKEKIPITKEIIDLTLSARDQIKSLFDACYRGGAADEEKGEAIIASFKKLLSDVGNKEPAGSSLPSDRGKTPSEKRTTYRVRFQPTKDFFTKGMAAAPLLDELRRLGPCKVVTRTDAVPHLEDYNPDVCYMCVDALLTTDKGRDAVDDVFVFVKDAGELNVDLIDEEGRLDIDADYKKLGEILVERGDLTPEHIKRVLSAQKRFGEILVETGLGTPENVESALAEQQHVRELRKERLKAVESASIRVSTEKLDGLVDLVGELVTIQARLSQTALSHDIPEFRSIAEQVERLTGDLHDKTMDIRMLPIGTTFSKFKRVVRDLSQELHKEIELTTEGAETELDKTVIERLSDPLIHLIRNSIDHGIEPPDVREAAGKPRRGTVRLSGAHSGAYVLIHISDDGAGIDREAIRAKAVEKGLLQPDAAPTDRELLSLVFAPGFSTAKTVTDVSGRGVGLDVVKKTIEAFRGSIEINSRRGIGTTITLKLPLTLAIIEGLLVTIQEQYFVLPLSFVKECVELTAADKKNSHGRQIANVRGEIVPYINLRERFLIEGESPSIEQIVITETDGNRVGFVVDTVIGGHQTVIKNLGKFYRDAEGISGATLLGDGTVALILDVPKLVRMVEQQEAQLTREDALFIKI